MIILKTNYRRSLVWFGVLLVCNQSLSQSASEVSLKVREHKGQVEVTWQGSVLQGTKYRLERSRDDVRFETIYEFDGSIKSYTDPEAIFGIYYYRVVSRSGLEHSHVATVETYAGDTPIHLRPAKPETNRFNLVLGNSRLNSTVLTGIYKLNGDMYRPFNKIFLEKHKLVLDGSGYEKGSYIAVISIPDSHIILARFDVE